MSPNSSIAAAPAAKKAPKPITGPAARPSQAAALFGVHISTIWRWVAELPDFPKPRKVSSRTTCFVTAELIAFRDKNVEAK